MFVVATAGHVDHGKSTLVRALTGMEPDRWAEERRRGMTIDLGYAWTTLPAGPTLAFVDVPGHQRFLGNMLAGLGPAPAVLFVVAADEGWRRQSGDHLAAVDALGLRHGLLAVTRSDLADPADAIAQAAEQLSRSSLANIPAVAVSGRTGAGIPALRTALAALVAELPPPDADAPVRLWIDRAFTVQGSGTVVTGTLGSGRLAVGDTLMLGERTVQVRSLQSLGRDTGQVTATARVAVNLRGVARDDVSRGDALLAPGRWTTTATVDIQVAADPLPTEALLHVGTAGVPVRLRPLGPGAVRLTLHRPLPVAVGDRVILRDPGRQVILAGAVVVDVDPPALRRRGEARRRGAEVAAAPGRLGAAAELERRGCLHHSEIVARGMVEDGLDTAHRVGDWFVSGDRWATWTGQLLAAVDQRARAVPLDPGLATEAARHLLDVPDPAVLTELAAGAGLENRRGRLLRPGTVPSLGPAEAGLADIERRLAATPFAAPEHDELVAAGLGVAQLAAAVRLGRLIRCGDSVVLLPDAPARAMRLLSGLPQPFTASDARASLATTRRVVIPLLELLDERGWTRRVDGVHRMVVR
jgi:selenocysteine-specific elongation factor